MSRYEHPKPDGRTKLRIEPIRVNHAHAIMTEDFDEETSTGIVVARTSDNVDVGWAKLLAAAPTMLAALHDTRLWVAQYLTIPGHADAAQSRLNMIDKAIAAAEGGAA